MPNEEETEADELVFLSPEEDFHDAEADKDKDQGASPVLRRSNRKRKSVASEMTKGSGTKKKKNSSPKQDKESSKGMPKLPRTPQGAAQQQAHAQQQEGEETVAGQAGPGPGFEAMLLAMEGRITAKIERASEASRQAAQQAKMNSESLEQLESRVDANEQCMMEALLKSEERILLKVKEQMQDQVRVMVNTQLAEAGFDQDLTAGDLSLRKSAMVSTINEGASYAKAASSARNVSVRSTERGTAGKDGREDKFWRARRSLRLWPVRGGDRAGLVAYLKEKLRLDDHFVNEELGEVELFKPRDPRQKIKNTDEYVAVFETKQVRDAVKAAAANLANYRDTAGMKLHLPDHLQRDFQTLMNLYFDLKKKNPELKRNVKFDEEDRNLYMDIRLKEGAEWRRVKPKQAEAANRKRKNNNTKDIEQDELTGLLESSSDSESGDE